jgi:hypothetical protein
MPGGTVAVSTGIPANQGLGCHFRFFAALQGLPAVTSPGRHLPHAFKNHP